MCRFICMFILSAGFFCTSSMISAQQTYKHFIVHELADGVLACIHSFGGKAICNAAIIDNGNYSVIFDSFLSPEAAEDLKDTLKAYAFSPLKYVINSHYHNDHIRGNQVFADHAEFISTQRTAELIKEREPLEIADEQTYAADQYKFYDSLFQNYSGSPEDREFQRLLMWRPYFEVLSKSAKEIETIVPEIFVYDTMHLDGPKRSIQLISKGAGHTESDLIAYLPDDRILFAGDLIFNACHPYVGNGNLDSLLNWYTFLNSLDIDIVIPGHGEPGSKELVQTMNEYIENLILLSDQWKQSGKTTEDLETLEIPQVYRTWWFDRFYTYNFRFALKQAH